MLPRTSIALAFGSMLAFHDARAGCGVSFQIAIVDSAGQVIDYLNSDLGEDVTGMVTVPAGSFFRAQVSFPSCTGGSQKLWCNGVLVQEWEGIFSVWTTDQAGLYEWWVEGSGYNGPPPMTRFFQVSSGSATAVGVEVGEQDFILRSLVVADDSPHAFLSCRSERATDLRVEIMSLEGRLQHTSLHPVQPGENLVRLDLPFPAKALALVRLITGEGAVRMRKLVF